MSQWLDSVTSILIAIAFVAFAMKISWAAWNDFKPGGNLGVAIATPLLKIGAFGITYLFVVNLLPFMANYGFAQAYNSVDSSSLRAGAVEVIGSTASLFSEQPYVAEIEVPDAPPLADVLPSLPSVRPASAQRVAAPNVEQAARPTAAQVAPQPTSTPGVPPWRNVTSYKDPKTGEIKSLVPTPQSKASPAPASTPAGGPSAGAADAAASAVGTQVYTVKAGDSLHKIAKAHYDDGDKWRAICTANKSILGGSCNQLRPGQIILIP